jgi:hypothetical protein
MYRRVFFMILTSSEVSLENYGSAVPGRSKAKYMRALRRVANRQTEEVVIDLADLRKVCLVGDHSV